MKKRQAVLIIVLAIAGIGNLGCGLLGPAVEDTFTQVLGAAGEDFLQALSEENYEAAYDLCTSDLQAEIGSPENMVAMFSATPHIESWTYDARTAEMQEESETIRVVVFEGEVTFSNGQSGILEIVLYPESGTTSEGDEVPYRVAGFTIRPE